MPARLLVIGRNGQLATALAARRDADLAITCAGREDFDLADSAVMPTQLDKLAPDAVINAGAYTAVDKAETEPETAFALNRDGPAALARACAARQIPFVHISTDYVFDGAKPAPYREDDPKSPQNVYGRSKSEGEDLILASHDTAAVLRTSWVYSVHGANFLKTMLHLASDRDVVRDVADQHGRPTWAPDLANAAIVAARALLTQRAEAAGVFHYSGGGDANWAEFAREIFACSARQGGPSAKVEAITTAQYPTPARRPLNSRLDTTKFETVFNLSPRPWREAVALCMRELRV